MTAPTRIQQRRTAGWKKPAGAVAVGRGTRWGNPYRIEKHPGRPGSWWVLIGSHIKADVPFRDVAVDLAVRLFRDLHARHESRFADLADKDLMCWCPLDQPCHADVLLELANRSEERRVGKECPV